MHDTLMNIIDWIKSKLPTRQEKQEESQTYRNVKQELDRIRKYLQERQEESQTYRELKQLLDQIDNNLAGLTTEKLLLARQELLEWRGTHNTDYRGRPLLAPKCKCGAVLQHWPDSDDPNIGIWCANLNDQAAYNAKNTGSPDTDFFVVTGIKHDIYGERGNLLMTGRCTPSHPTTLNAE